MADKGLQIDGVWSPFQKEPVTEPWAKLTLVSPELAAAATSGAALLCYFYLQNSVHTLQEPELLPLHSPQHQSKSTFCTEYPARQSHFITFPLSSCWLPAAKSRLHLISKFEGIFLVYFHTDLDCNISYPGTCCATNLKTDFPQKPVKRSSQHQEGTWAQQYRYLVETFPLLPWSS